MLIPQTVFTLRGSDGLGLESAYGSSVAPGAVPGVLKHCKLQYKINLFGLRCSLVPLEHISGMFRMMFLPNLVDIVTKH